MKFFFWYCLSAERGDSHHSAFGRCDGALAGNYKVTSIETRKQMPGPDNSNIAPGLMNVRYYDLKTSGLEATVKPGTNPITLSVERAPRR